MSQERKKSISLALKPILDKYKIKASLSVDNHSTIILKITKSHLDFIGNYEEVLRNSHYRMNQGSNKSVGGKVVFDFKNLSLSHYHIEDHFDGICRDFLKEAFAALNDGNHDRSDSQSDYFDVGWYSYIKIGTWDKPYILEKIEEKEIVQSERKVEYIKTETLQLVSYSEKAIAVFGDTKPLKEKLKALGGRFNPFLQQNGEKVAGWIFSKTKEDELKQLLTN